MGSRALPFGRALFFCMVRPHAARPAGPHPLGSARRRRRSSAELPHRRRRPRLHGVDARAPRPPHRAARRTRPPVETAGSIPTRLYRPPHGRPAAAPGLLPRRRLGDRQPRHARRRLPRRSRKQAGCVVRLGRLPPGARSTLPGRRRRLLRRHASGPPSNAARLGVDPDAHRRRRRQRRRQPDRRRGPAWPATGAARRSASSC